MCAGKDRFWINTQGVFGCRHCEPSGDNQEAFTAILKALGCWNPSAVVKPLKTHSTTVYTYQDADGADVMRQVRRDFPDDQKDIRSWSYYRGAWHPNLDGITGHRPLYRLPDLLAKPEDDVHIVEGEKCADEVRRQVPEVLVTTPSGGTGAWRKTDFSPIHARERVFIWADNDRPGRKFARQLAHKLSPAVGEVLIVDLATYSPAVGAAGDVFDVLRKGGIKAFWRAISEHTERYTGAKKSPENAVIGERLDEYEASMLFAHHHHDKVRYDYHAQRWHVLTPSGIWAPDHPGKAKRLAADLVATIEGGERLKQNRNVEGLMKLAQVRNRIAVSGDVWDQGQQFLGTPEGVYDLQADQILPPVEGAKRMITQQLAAAPADHESPLLNSMLKEWTQGDEGQSRWLQVFMGYGLLGDPVHHAFGFLSGPSRTGKTTFSGLMLEMFADYGAKANINTFLQSKHDAHLTELARLANKRFVLAVEPPKNRKWNESRLNEITGGETITANFMRRNMFEFRPKCLLLFAGNHVPTTLSVGDGAMRARMRNIPFKYVPPVKRGDLGKSLSAEMPGVVRWAVNGLRKYLDAGRKLPHSDAIEAHTTEYLESQDIVSQWVEECCLQGPDYWQSTKKLFRSFEAWHIEELSRPPTGNAISLAKDLVNLQCVSKKKSGQRGWQGIDLKDSATSVLPAAPAPQNVQPNKWACGASKDVEKNPF